MRPSKEAIASQSDSEMRPEIWRGNGTCHVEPYRPLQGTSCFLS